MSKTYSLACWDYDRAQPILDGSIKIAGYDVRPEMGSTGKLFPLAVGDAPYDVTEMSLASYLIQTARGESKYIALPIFLSRAFRHGAVYVRADAGINRPEDLEGRTVGVPEYAMTMALWVRGLLSDEYGVDVGRLKYRTSGLNELGRVERLNLDMPASLDLAPLGDKTLNDGLLDGTLDAILSAAPPKAFIDGDPRVLRLIDPPGPAERAYFQKTGIFPVMHAVGVRKEIADTEPGLCVAVYEAFLEGRRQAMARCRAVAAGSANRIMSPWFADGFEDAVSVMGSEFWPYGVAENVKAIDALCRYAFDQHLTPVRLTPEQLFHASVMDLPGT